MKNLLTCLLLLTAGTAAAQLSGPNASAYNKYTDKYYITNYGAKSVVEMDRNGNKSTFITGLTAPNNILFGILPFGSGFLVLDSNEVKVYDSTGDYLATQTVSGAKKLQDCVFDDAAGALYTSDVLRGVIYKTTFGPAPFYIPSTSVFASGIARPSAMILQKAKNRILFVQDTAGSDLKALNLSNGQVSSLRSLGLSNVVGLAEDGQGNLYISSQGEKFIYQLNRFYAGNPVKLISEPKPGDLTVNVQKDEWVYTCILCGTVFIPRLHVFGPGNEQLLCRNDSFEAYRNILQKCIGTFEAGNEFIMELSSSSGSFASPTFLARKSDTLVPDLISSRLPAGIRSGNYRYRWRSTKPAITGTFETFTVHPDPVVYVSGSSHSDTIFACQGSTLTMGGANSADPDITYAWQPPSAVDTASNRVVRATVKSGFRISVSAVSAATGCKAKDSAWVAPVAAPSGGKMADTVNICYADTAGLGSPRVGGLTYTWSPGRKLNDSTLAQPYAILTESAWFRRTVTASGGCSSTDSQYVMVHLNPIGFLNTDTINFICRGERQSFWFISRSAGTRMTWSLPGLPGVEDDSFHIINNDESLFGTGSVLLTTAGTGCQTRLPITVLGKPHFYTGILTLGDTGLAENGIDSRTRRWYRNDTLLTDTSRTLLPRLAGQYRVCATNPDGCEDCAGPVTFTPKAVLSATGLQASPCAAYPNPTNGLLHLPCHQGPWQLFTLSGQLLCTGHGPTVDLSDLPAGVYVVKGNGMVSLVVRE